MISILAVLFLIVNTITCSTIYGVVTLDTGSETTFTTYLGEVNPTTGDVTTLFPLATFFEAKVGIIGGNTAFDQKNKIFYFSDNSNTDFVYALDIANQKILRLYSSLAFEIFGVAYDSGSGNLVLSGFYGTADNFYEGVVFMPTTSDSAQAAWFNFSQEIGGTPFAGGTVDSTNSIFYTVYSGPSGEKIAAIDIATQKATSSAILDCKSYLPFDLTFDSANSNLFSIGFQSSNYAYLAIDPKTFACDVTPLKLSDVNETVILTTYDPSTQTIYLLTAAGIATYNIKSQSLTSPVATQYDIEAWAVSYP